MEGYIKEIHHSVGQRKRFRELVTFYHDTIKSQTRVKNKIKCKFRQYGIASIGKTIYDKKYQSIWFKKLPNQPMIHFMIQRLWDQLEKIQDNVEKTEKILKKQSKLYKEIDLFQQIPGIGPIHSATISAILENPYRFSKKSRLWKYSGLGIVCKGSGGKLYSEKLSKNYNRLLKYTIKQAALSAIKSKPNIFKNKYYKMLNNGVNPSRALLTLARSMLVTMWVMWKKGENFNPKIKKEKIGI
jgi:transposase